MIRQMDLEKGDKKQYYAHFMDNNRNKDKSIYLILSL